MKHFYILTTAIASLFLSQSFAQTLTATGSNPVIGEIFNYKTSSSFGPGPSGSGQTWNFSTISGVSGSSTAVTVASTPSGSSFPSANIAFNNSGGGRTYQNTSSASLQYYGSVTGGVVISYSNPEDLLRFPVSLSSSYTDNFSATFTSGTTIYRNGSIVFNADATGTIITPTSTYSNVVRVHTVETYRDSTLIFGTPQVTNYSVDQYAWYKDGIHYPIATTYTFTSGSSSGSGGSYYVSTSVGIEENSALANSINLFPNPTTETVRVKYIIENSTSVKVSVINIVGQEVYSQEITKVNTGEQNLDINVNNLDKGTYFVRIQTNDAIATKKIIVQ